MKKLLALVLALVMSMSLVTISNAAYDDAADIDYAEAVEVLSAVGVLEGSDGKFNPKAELTRSQACKIIAYLDLGKDIADALPALQVFSDVPADNWAAKYVAYCADAGYVSGVGDNKFDPDAKVTGYQFAKMLLCVLGYDAEYEQFTGSSWEINVAKKMKQLDLADGIEKAGSAALTREEAAQMAFNALKTQTVTANKGTTTKVEGVVSVTTGGSAATPNTNDYNYYEAELDEDNPDKALYLTEQLYGKSLIVRTTVGKNGKEINTWYYNPNGNADATNDDHKVGEYETEAADKTIIATKAGKSLNYWLETLNKDYSSDSYDSVFNGSASSESSVALGAEILVFLADSGDVEKVIVNTYKLEKIAKVTEVTNKDFSYNVKFVGGGTYADTKLPGFDAKTMEKDDYVLVLYEKSGTATVLEVKAPETVEGKVTAVGSDYIKVDGTKYTVIGSVSGYNYDDVYCLYLVNGYVIGSEVVEESDKADGYVYVLDADSQAYSDGGLLDGKDATVKVKVAYMDGTQATLDMPVEKVTATAGVAGHDKDGNSTIAKGRYYVTFRGEKYEVGTDVLGKDTAMTSIEGNFYNYTLNDDGEITLKALDSKTEDMIKVADSDDDGITQDVSFKDQASPAKTWKVNSSTKLVTIDTDGKTVSEFVGYKNFPTLIKDTDALVIHAEDSTIATTIYVVDEASYSKDVTYAYYIDDSMETVDSKKYYSFYVNGEEVSYELSDLDTGYAVFTVSGTTATAVANQVKSIVDEADDNFFVTGHSDTALVYADNVKVWDLTGDEPVAGTVAEGDSVVYVTKDDEVVIVYIIESLVEDQPETATELKALIDDSGFNELVTLGLAQVQDGTTLYISGTIDKSFNKDSDPGEDDLNALKKYFGDDSMTWASKYAEVKALKGFTSDTTKIGFVTVTVNDYAYVLFVYEGQTSTTKEFNGINMTINYEGLAW